MMDRLTRSGTNGMRSLFKPQAANKVQPCDLAKDLPNIYHTAHTYLPDLFYIPLRPKIVSRVYQQVQAHLLTASLLKY